MRHTIETALRDGKVVILDDDSTRDGYLSQEYDEASTASGSSSRARRLAIACWIAVPLIAATLIFLYFGFEHATPLPSEESRKTELLVLRQQAEVDQAAVRAGTRNAVQAKRAAVASALQRPQSLENEPTGEVLVNELSDTRQVIEGLRSTSTAKHPQTRDEESARNAALARELASAQRKNELQAAQLRSASEEMEQLKRAEAANSAQSLEQERQKTAAIAQEVAAARQELTTSTAEHRRALDEERARSAALASELARAQRENELQAAQLRSASEETGQLEQAEAANSARLLEQEREKVAALARGTAAVRQELTKSTAKYHLALDEKRARSAALTRELATPQGHNARQSWRAMLWLWGLPDTGAASRWPWPGQGRFQCLDCDPPRSSRKRQPAG